MTGGRRPVAMALVAFAGIVLGLFAEWLAWRSEIGSAGWLDLMTGWAIVGCGLLAWGRVPGSRIGPLLVATGLTWFIGSLGDRATDSGRFAAALTFLYAGVLWHALITYPTGRASRNPERVLVGAGYAAALFAPLWQRDIGLVLIALLMSIGLIVQRAVLSAAVRHARWPAFGMGLFLAATLGAKAFVEPAFRMLGAPVSLDVDTLLREVALVLVAGGLTWSLVGGERRRTATMDLVVELGGGRSPGLATELRRTIGDPSLEVGFWREADKVFADEAGQPMLLPAVGDPRTFLTIESDGRPVAVLVHDRGLTDDPTLRDAVARAAQMGARNSALRIQLSSQVAQLAASRRRLLEAGDEECRALEERLRLGAASRLASLHVKLGRLCAILEPKAPAAAAHLERASVQLARARVELDELAHGLDPGLVAERGLDGALRDLAERSTVPVDLALEPVAATGPSVGATFYFVASEALTNIARHSGASHAWVRLSDEQGRIRLVVEDDGVGGADPGSGSGLRGLRDRLEALGGTLGVATRVGGGTRLLATLPADGWDSRAPASSSV